MVKTCAHHSLQDKAVGCPLEAMWQVCLSFTPRWTTEIEPIKAWTGLVVCGLHKDDVGINDFGDVPNKLATAFTKGHPDALAADIWFLDISTGLWMDPGKPGDLSPVS